MSDQALATRLTAVLRVLLVPILFLGNQAVAHPLVGTLPFDLLIAAAAAYSLAMLGFSLRATRRPRPWLKAIVDLTLISLLAFCSGQGFSATRSAFLIVPFVAAVRLGPGRTAALSLVTGAMYILVALTHPVHDSPTVASVLAHSLFIVWTGMAAVVIAALRERSERRLTELSAARGRLVNQITEGDERVRKDVSAALHDGVVQDLLTARQDLAEAGDGDPDALGRVALALDEALAQLRGTIDDLDPYVLDHLDLADALETVAGRESRRGGYAADLEIDPEASGVCDGLVFSVARELLVNAAKHARASAVRVTLGRTGAAIVLEVHDDGRGFGEAESAAALDGGHIGLPILRERVAGVGGILTVISAAGEGTRVRCELPAPQTAAAASLQLSAPR